MNCGSVFSIGQTSIYRIVVVTSPVLALVLMVCFASTTVFGVQTMFSIAVFFTMLIANSFMVVSF